MEKYNTMDKEYRINELKSKMEELKIRYNALNLMENGIKNLEEYNIIAPKIGMMKIIPCMCHNNELPKERESGIYKSEMREIIVKYVSLNNELTKLIRNI